MSMTQLAEPCWTIHTPRAIGNTEHLAVFAHYTSELATRNAIAVIRAENAVTVDDPADRLRDLTPQHNTAECWIVRCDDCEQPARDDGTSDDPLHFVNIDNIIEAVGDWRTDRTGTPSLCPNCAAAAGCDTYGHDYGDWYACRCNGAIDAHVDGCPDYRYCLRCGLPGDPAYPPTNPQTAAARRAVA